MTMRVVTVKVTFDDGSDVEVSGVLSMVRRDGEPDPVFWQEVPRWTMPYRQFSLPGGSGYQCEESLLDENREELKRQIAEILDAPPAPLRR